MINFVEEYMTTENKAEEDGFDEQRIMVRSLSKVLPLIAENELTQRQRLCLKLFYVQHKSQSEIARELKLSQPTVSRHISAARDITNKYLGYCCYCVSKANEQWLKQQ